MLFKVFSLTSRTNKIKIICKDMELLRATWSSFHSFATKYILHTLTTSPFVGLGLSQSMKKMSTVHCSPIIHSTLIAFSIEKLSLIKFYRHLLRYTFKVKALMIKSFINCSSFSPGRLTVTSSCCRNVINQ